MKFLVFSDSHEYTNGLDRAIEKHADVTHIIHAGDVSSDVFYLESVYGKTHSICAVRGNNDFATPEPLSRVVMADSHRIYLTHGHKEHVKFGLYEIVKRSLEEKCDICIFGHTHVQMYEFKDGVHVLNPGSIGYFKQQYAVIDIDKNNVKVELFSI